MIAIIYNIDLDNIKKVVSIFEKLNLPYICALNSKVDFHVKYYFYYDNFDSIISLFKKKAYRDEYYLFYNAKNIIKKEELKNEIKVGLHKEYYKFKDSMIVKGSYLKNNFVSN